MTRPDSLRKNPLAGFLDQRLLRRLAGARAFARGEEYFAGEQVGALVEQAGTVAAKVQGTRTYRVKLWRNGGELDYACTCPVGQDGAFCKHGVAVGLAWLDAGSSKVLSSKASSSKASARTKTPAPPRVTLDDVRAQLLTRDKRALVELLMQQAVEDDDLRRRLLMEAASGDPKRLDLATYRQAIDEAVDVGGFVDYREAWDYARGIDAAIDGIEKLLKQGHAAEAIDLAEHALAAVEEAMGSVDDSGGEMGGILERLQALHHRACKKAKADPETLARRLFAWELRTDWDVFYGAAQTYADVFGKKGLAVYRTLAEAEWQGVPALGRGRDDPEKYGKRFRITHIMETLARQTGDVEALVAVKQRDLSSAWAYLQIAEIYQAAGRHDPALEWAERGLKTFPARTDARLREFLAQAYHRRRRHDEAMALIWAGFTESPGLETYKHLLTHAGRIGQRTSWRDRALEHLRQAIGKAGQHSPTDGWAPRRIDRSLLVQIFLWEKDAEAAWREAQAGGCSNGLWMELAAKREKTHPHDALPIYQRQIEPTLDRTNNDAYRQAVALLRKVRELMGRLGRETDFARYLSGVRATHRRKRNFMKLLDRVRW